MKARLILSIVGATLLVAMAAALPWLLRGSVAEPVLASGPFAYIPNISSNNVSIVDTATNTVVDTIPVGIQPRGVAVNPAGTRVYVTGAPGKVIDATTNAVLGEIPIDGTGIAISSDGTRVYGQSGMSVAVIDTITNSVIASLPVLAPWGLAVTPNGSRLYATTGNSVTVIDLASRSVVAVIPVGVQNRGITVNPSGTQVYVADQQSGVYVIDVATNVVVGSKAADSAPQAIAFSPDGSRAYVTLFGADSVMVMDTATMAAVAFVDLLRGSLPRGRGPIGIATNPDGTRVYAVNAVTNNVSVIDAATNTVVTTVGVGTFPFALGQFIMPAPSAQRLSIEKTGPSVVAANPGVPVNYTVTVTNSGSGTATGLTVTDTMPGELNLTAAAWSRTVPPGSGSCGSDVRRVTCNIGDLGPGGVATVTLDAALRYVPVGGSIANMACLTALNPPPGTGNCDTAVTGVGSAVSGADLDLSHDQIYISSPGAEGTPVILNLGLTNNGPGPVAGAVVTHQVPYPLAVNSASWSSPSSSGSCAVSVIAVQCAVGDVPEGESVSITINASVGRNYNGAVTAWASVTPADGNPQNNASLVYMRFAGTHRKIVFVQGINSDSDCTSNGSTFTERVKWIHDYLVTAGWVKNRVPLTSWNPSNGGDFRYFSYANRYICPGGVGQYNVTDTCAGIRDAASKLGDYLDSLKQQDPDVRFDFIAHSMGGVVVAKWLFDHSQGGPDDIARRVNSVVTLDSPLAGVPKQSWLALVTLNWGKNLGEACGPTSASASDLRWDADAALIHLRSEVIREVMQAGRSNVPFFTVDATLTEWASGRLAEVVPGDRTRISREVAHLQVDRNHSGVRDWSDPNVERDQRQRLLECIGKAVTSVGRCTSLYEQVSLATNESRDFTFQVSPEDASLETTALWSEGAVALSLTAPDGTVTDSQTVDQDVVHDAGEGYEAYRIHQPQPGIWTFTIMATDAPPGGADASLSADTAALPPPDADEDGSPDGEDNCAATANSDQTDTDADGQGDACDADDDDDTLDDGLDNCPLLANLSQEDTDGDGLGDACDGDNDNDGMQDAVEDGYACLDLTVDDGALDPDADSLANLVETLVGTDPCLPDSDGDNFDDRVEMSMGTDPLAACPTVVGAHDAWPPDFNDDTRVNLSDVFIFRPHFATVDGDPNYGARFDLTADGRINLADVFVLRQHFASQCSP